MLVHNQALVWLSSAGLGFLVFLVAKDLELGVLPALLLGAACQSVYQAFPFKLRFYWEILHPTTMSVVLTWFLVILYRLLRPGGDCGRRCPRSVAIGLPVFRMSYVDYVAAFFVALTVFVAMRLLDRPGFERLNRWKPLVLPATLVLGLFLFERILVGFLHPEVQAVDSGFLARTGLDESMRYVADHWAPRVGARPDARALVVPLPSGDRDPLLRLRSLLGSPLDRRLLGIPSGVSGDKL